MSEPKYSYIDPENGNVMYKGPLEIIKADHSGMIPYSQAFLPGDERGHVCASSLSPYAVNTAVNVVPQNGADINHGAWLHTENGERAALKEGATIYSEKTAYVDSQIGDRPHTFTVDDYITYGDGHIEQIHFSFPNESYASQEAFNELSVSMPDTFEGVNPGDTLRADMDINQYAELMESSDLLLPSIEEEYIAADYSGVPIAASSASDGIVEEAGIDANETETTTDVDAFAGNDSMADCSTDT